MNLVMDYERLRPGQLPRGVPYILYQLEQLACGTPVTPVMRDALLGAGEVWEYSPTNIPALQQLGVQRIKLLPLGFHQALQTIAPAQEDMDILFYGTHNARRRHILIELAKTFRVRFLFLVYGQERDSWIARSKITINIHNHDGAIAEQVRVSYLLNNRRCVVSEQSTPDPLAPFCTSVPYENLVEACTRLLRDPQERQRVTDAGYEGFKKIPMPDLLRGVLGDLA
jgi:hypothetical protein